MSNQAGQASSILFGSRAYVGLGRGLAEFRAGRPLRLMGGGETVMALPVEGLTPARLAAFAALCAPSKPRLVITARRARTLGIDANTPVELPIADVDAAGIIALVTDTVANPAMQSEAAGPAAAAAVDLAKLAQALPAVLVADARAIRTADIEPAIVTVESGAVAQFRSEATQSLTIAGEAHIPVASGIRTRFVVFRDALGDDPVAVIVGTPDMSKPVPVRLHSACMTGDVFGSRRCDCGDQLRLALTRLHEIGGGVILYLSQEGRGVGLANKMRTYKLQDAGLDTVDANTTLGFDDDERDYGVAVRMLQMLGCTRVMLLTNNPAKLDGLAKAGIEIAGRIPLEAPINPDNRRYMTAKAARSRHQLGHLLESLDKPAAAVDGKVASLAG